MFTAADAETDSSLPNPTVLTSPVFITSFRCTELFSSCASSIFTFNTQKFRPLQGGPKNSHFPSSIFTFNTKSFNCYKMGQKNHHFPSSILISFSCCRAGQKPLFLASILSLKQLVSAATVWAKRQFSIINLHIQTICFSCYRVDQKTATFHHQSEHSNSHFHLLQGGPKNIISPSILTFKKWFKLLQSGPKIPFFTINLNSQKII